MIGIVINAVIAVIGILIGILGDRYYHRRSGKDTAELRKDVRNIMESINKFRGRIEKIKRGKGTNLTSEEIAQIYKKTIFDPRICKETFFGLFGGLKRCPKCGSEKLKFMFEEGEGVGQVKCIDCRNYSLFKWGRLTNLFSEEPYLDDSFDDNLIEMLKDWENWKI